VQLHFAHSVRTVFLLVAAVMAVACLVAVVAVPRGRVEEPVADAAAEPQPVG
jgi:hypothetical protein